MLVLLAVTVLRQVWKLHLDSAMQVTTVLLEVQLLTNILALLVITVPLEQLIQHHVLEAPTMS